MKNDFFTFKGFHPATVLWGLILMGATAVAIEPILNLFPAEWYAPVGERIVNGGWAMLAALVVAPIVEEILFRGLLQRWLVKKWGPWIGILVASAVFGLVHRIPQQMVAGFCMGAILGWTYWRTGSLLSAMLLHAINNALSVFLTLFESERTAAMSLRQSIGNDGIYIPLHALCASLVLGSLIIAILRQNRLVRNREPVEKDH